MLRKRSKTSGFSLVELLVVITIIAILSVTAYVALGGQTGKARNSKRQSDLSTIQNALELYFVENGSLYPAATAIPNRSHLDDGAAGGTDLVPKFMPDVPTDPSSPAVAGAAGALNYTYVVSTTRKQYWLAASLEMEDGTFKSYVIGNCATGVAGCSVPGFEPVRAGTTACAAPGDTSVVEGSTTCVPYNLP